MSKAIVIGAGIGGIAAALRLRHVGLDVEVFEAADHTGGKLSQFEMDGFRFDRGPSLFTLPGLVDELFSLFGETPAQHFRYRQIEESCRYFWEDGTRFTAAADSEQFIREASECFGVSDSRIDRYLKANQRKYDLTADLFLERSLHRWRNFMNAKTLRALLSSWRLDIHRSLHDTNANALKEPRLVQLFDRYATYNGSSPYRTPGIMSMIPHLEMMLGTYLPDGGMYDIAESLTSLAQKQGVRFHLSTKVESILISGRKAVGIRTTKDHHADIVVSNLDIHSLYTQLLPQKYAPRKSLVQERSSSAFVFYWGINRLVPELGLHNILFSEDYKQEFQDLFYSSEPIDDPTVYINITSKHVASDAPCGMENWFVMINAPRHQGQDWHTLMPNIKKNIIQKIQSNLSINMADHIIAEKYWTPLQIQEQTASHQGSLYGSSSNSRFSAFLRHPNFSKKLEGLYFCGGSVHPGGGIPLCLHSAKIVSDLIKSKTCKA